MRIAYFDCFSGISGDMILGALVDAGLDLGELESELGKLHLPGYQLAAEKVTRKGISGTKVSIEVQEGHGKRHLKDILESIEQSPLEDNIKSTSRRIFEELATTEAKIHDKQPKEVHFHEIGGLDSIVDVVGSLIGLKKLGIERVGASRIHVGTGFVECAHGTLPVPVPATLELLKGIPVYSRGIEVELVTPSGAAILKNVSRSFGLMPEMTVETMGYGAGSRELEIPNLLRVCIGKADGGGYERDEVILIETNIDDMNPELFGYVSEKLLEQGVLDTYITPVHMKKNRPGTMLSVLIQPDKLDEVLSTLFAETTSLGVRIQSIERRKLAREIVSVKTRFGKIRVKVGRVGGAAKNIAPEYEDCKRIATEQGVPLKNVYDEARLATRELLLKGS